MAEPMTDEEVNAVALGVFRREIFTSDQCREDEVHQVFFPLVFLSKAQLADMLTNQISLFYEYLDKERPRGVNGNPLFFSYRMASETDHRRIRDRYNQIVVAAGLPDRERW